MHYSCDHCAENTAAEKLRDFANLEINAWRLGPRLLVGLRSSELSSYVQKLYDDKTKRCHLIDLKVYCSSKRTFNELTLQKDVMRYAGFIGQRPIDLHSSAYFS